MRYGRSRGRAFHATVKVSQFPTGGKGSRDTSDYVLIRRPLVTDTDRSDVYRSITLCCERINAQQREHVAHASSLANREMCETHGVMSTR